MGQQERLRVTLACGNYDRIGAIRDGRVEIEGCCVNYIPLEPEQAFVRALKYQEFDISELSFSSYMLQTSRDECAYIAIPVFLSRVFRHSGIYIRTDRGIKHPTDLRGRRVGVPEYKMTALVWIRGMLQEEYGVSAHDIHWFHGSQEEVSDEEHTPVQLRNGIHIEPLPAGMTLSRALAEGKLDAVCSAREPLCHVDGAPNVGRLFPDSREAEKQYYRKTGLFPIMHLVGIRKTLVEKHPWLPASVYKAFCAAKDIAMRQIRDLNALVVTLPWGAAEAQETIALMGADYWRYGVAENLKEIETLARYSYEQGLAVRLLKPEDLFARSTLEVSKI